MTQDEVKNPVPAEETTAANPETPAESVGEPAAKPVENPLLMHFDIFMSRDDIEKEIDVLAEKYKTSVKVPGFRPGKVTAEMVKKAYRPALLEETLQNAVSRLAFAHIQKEKMRIASEPQVEDMHHQDGEDLTARIAVEIYPEITLPELESVVVEIPKAELEGQPYDEEKRIDEFLEAHKRTVPVRDRAVQEEDLVLIRFQSKVVGTHKMSPKSTSYVRVKREHPNEIADLFDELVGKNAGDSLHVTRSYPADHQKKPWAGHEVEHFIEIQTVYELKKPQLDADFLKTIGMSDEAAFRQRLKEEHEHQLEHHRKDASVQYIFAKLGELVQFPLPQSMVKEEISRLLSQNRQPVTFRDDKDRMDFVNTVAVSAQVMVKNSLIVEKIKDQNKIEVTADDLRAEYKHLAEHNHISEKEVQRYFADKGKLEELKSRLLEPKVIDFVKSRVQIKEV